MSGDREKRIARQRARIRELEAARDAFRAQAEASLVVPCACGRPMPSVSSRLRCDACRAEGERDEARAAVGAMRLVTESLREAIADRAGTRMGKLRHSEWWGPDQWATIHAPSDAGAPLLAELRALRAVRDAAEAFLSPPTLHAIGDARERLRAALDAAKAGG